MKKYLVLAIIAIALSACTHTSVMLDQRLCGKWMTSDQRYNRERFDLKPDGTFTDVYYNNMFNKATPETWEVANNKLLLQYKYHVLLFTFHHSMSYRIISFNDSVLVVGTRGSKRYPARTMAFKKMKLNGKFITS